MPSRDLGVDAVLRLAGALDGAVLGLALAYCTAVTWIKYFNASSALRRLQPAPSVPISGLRALLLLSPDKEADGGKLVVVRGKVQPSPAIKSHGAVLASSQGSGERAVVVELSQTCVYNEVRSIFGWSLNLPAIFTETWKKQKSSSLRSVPFVLVENGHWPHCGYVNISLDGSAQPLPLTTVYHCLHPVQATPFTTFLAIFGNGYPVALLDKEKILPVGREVTAVGICRDRGGALEIKSCAELPCFLSDKTKDEIEVDLAISSMSLFWSGILLGTLSAGLLGYAIARNWWRWEEWTHRRRQNQQLQIEAQDENESDEELQNLPDGQMCAVCLLRRRRSAFVPCGHLVCCPQCAVTVEQDSSPKCPVCRQDIQSSIRIYDS